MKETEKQNVKFIVCYMVAGEKLAKRYILTLCQSYFQALNFIFLGISATKNLCKPLKYCTINAS